MVRYTWDNSRSYLPDEFFYIVDRLVYQLCMGICRDVHVVVASCCSEYQLLNRPATLLHFRFEDFVRGNGTFTDIVCVGRNEFDRCKVPLGPNIRRQCGCGTGDRVRRLETSTMSVPTINEETWANDWLE